MRKRIGIVILMACLLAVALIVKAVYESKVLQRSSIVLMNKYYKLKLSHPQAAKQALVIILQHNPHHIGALKELSAWMLHDNKFAEAEPLLQRLHEKFPDVKKYTQELAYVYYKIGVWQKAVPLYSILLTHKSAEVRFNAQESLRAMESYIPSVFMPAAIVIDVKTTTHSPVTRVNVMGGGATPIDASLDRFYYLSKQDEPRAWRWLVAFIRTHPNNVIALKEAVFLAIRLHYIHHAIYYAKRAYALTAEASIAMQLGYLYSKCHYFPRAYQYFQYATSSYDGDRALAAKNAMTSLSGLQIKAIPAPYYAELYFAPFTQTRFGLTVTTSFARLGVEADDVIHSKAYVFQRRTEDNKSSNLGQLPEIYEDAVQIFGAGLQVSPLPGIPVTAFAEVGAAYDLVYRSRQLWRDDVRGGLMYFQAFGASPAYFARPTFNHRYYSDWYADATYFSRYNNNVIGVIRTHQGLRALQYHASMINLYVVGRAIGDTNRYFFNNLAEIGPGIAFIPSNRFNLELRYEAVRGVYLPAGEIFNPYSKYYSNQIVQLVFYAKI